MHPTDLTEDPTATDSQTAAALAAEHTHLAASRAALGAMRDRAEQLFRTGEQVAGDAYTAEQLGRQMARRIKELADDPSAPLFFGKLSMLGTDPDSAEHDPRSQNGGEDRTGDRWHIGRRHISDGTGDPLVLDWRAPVSRAFYQASASDPQGVAVRRRFGWSPARPGEPTRLTGFEDEHLSRGEELGTASALLTAEIERPRVGPMRDIVATIQPDQDELVRAGLDETICVQGAPGTGKTNTGL